MLTSMWSKENVHSLPMGTQACTTTMEISVMIPNEAGIRYSSRVSDNARQHKSK